MRGELVSEAALPAGLPDEGGPARFFVGVAGWALPHPQREAFPRIGTHLERYATRLRAVEINSSFYRNHQPKTYERWAASVPEDFRFSVKLARAFTHEARLSPSGDSVKLALDGVHRLGSKLGVLLVQLPPSLAFDARRAGRFFGFLREHARCPLALEPRHPTWAHDDALALIERLEITKVIADPERCPCGRLPSSDGSLRYYRLHGRPEIYRSPYRAPFLGRLALSLEAAPSRSVWCIFDNTTFGNAIDNALELSSLLGRRAEKRSVS